MSSRNSTKSKGRGDALEIETHGGYMADKTRKLDNQFFGDIQTNQEKAGTSSKLFSGVCIHVNGYTDPSSDELKRLMMLHGGRYQHYYALSKVTHIIATNLPYAKIRQLRNEKIVKPEWITESIIAGHLLPSFPYELYTDRSSGSNQSTLHFSRAANNNKGSDHSIQHSDVQSAGDASIGESSPEEGPRTPGPDEELGNKLVTGLQGRPGRPSGVATAGDANFLSEFYGNSRLHHISMWGAECKAYVNELQSGGDQTFPGKQRFLELMRNRKNTDWNVGEAADSQDTPEWLDNIEGDIGVTGIVGYQSDSLQGGGHRERVGKAERVIMHVDMDCFFVSVGLIQRPDLVDKPIAVTHSKGQVGMSDTRQEIREFEHAYYAKKMGSDRTGKHGKDRISESTGDDMKGTKPSGQSVVGPAKTSTSGKEDDYRPKETFHSMAEIASCNYEARKQGVKNGMFMGRAKTLCPDIQTIAYDFEGYKRVSQMLYDIVASYTHEIEAVSCDEMFVDISGILQEAGVTPLEFAEVLRAEIREKTLCNASAGMASNILLARMATRVAKPDGQYYVESHCVDDFIKPQPVKDLPGVGRSMNRKLENLNIRTCRDLQQISQDALQKEFGPKTGQCLYRFCRGQDDRPIRQEQERKSVSAEVNYGIRFMQESESDRFITELAAEVHKRLTAIKMQARTIMLKLKVRHPDAPKETSKFMGHGICKDKARASTMGQATDDLQVIQRECSKLLKELQVPAIDMRGVGIQLSKLSSRHQPRSSATSITSKSITAFMTKPKLGLEPISNHSLVTEDSSTNLTNAAKESQNVDTRTKKGARMMNGDGECSHVNQHDPNVAAAAVTTPRKKKKRELPPLPFMPSMDGPSTVCKLPVSTDVALPSPSQIDISVLSALPKDIQEQIIRDCGGQNQAANRVGLPELFCIEDPHDPSMSSGITHSSKWDQDVLKSLPTHILKEVIQSDRHGNKDGDVGTRPLEESDRSSLGLVEALPSFSQIDQSCLDALPPEMQEELQAAYRGQAGSVHSEPQRETCTELANRGSAPATTCRSPAKGSPAKSPFKIRKRGRPRKGSPRGKTNQPKNPRWQLGIQELITRNRTPPKLPRGANQEMESSPANCIIQPEGEEDGDEEEEEEEEKKEEMPVNLCGAVQLWDVKSLLKEWISSTEEPVEEDVGFIVQYLRELILDKNLEMVDLVIRSLRRFTLRKACPSWMDAYKTVVARIQHTMSQIYGAQLKFA